MNQPEHYQAAPIDPQQLREVLGGFTCGSVLECRFVKPYMDFHHLKFPKTRYYSQPHEGIAMCRCKHEALHQEWEISEDLL